MGRVTSSPSICGIRRVSRILSRSSSATTTTMCRVGSPPAYSPLSMGALFSPTFLALIVYLVWRLYSRPTPRPALRSVAILVLGDIGRSPRMMYQAESFAKNNFLTYLVGYGGALPVVPVQDWRAHSLEGSKPIPSLLSSPDVSIMYLTEPPTSLRRLPFVLGGPLKVLRQILEIVHTLAIRIPHPPEFILVQVCMRSYDGLTTLSANITVSRS